MKLIAIVILSSLMFSCAHSNKTSSNKKESKKSVKEAQRNIATAFKARDIRYER